MDNHSAAQFLFEISSQLFNRCRAVSAVYISRLTSLDTGQNVNPGDNILSTAFQLSAGGGCVLQAGDEAFDVVEAAVQHGHVLLVTFAGRRTRVVVDGVVARSDQSLSVK